MNVRRSQRSLSGLLVMALVVGWVAACDRSRNATPPSSTSLDTEQSNNLQPTAPPPPPEGAFLAQLSPEQTSQLTSLGIDVVVPGVVPPAFRVADLRISQGDMGLGYIIVYQNAENQCFAIEFADDGMGDPPATASRLPLQPPLFGDQGYGLNYGEFADPAMRSQFPGNNLYTDWMIGRSGAYRLMGATSIKEVFPAAFDRCQDISPEAAVDLVESFTLLTSAPMGEGWDLDSP